MKAFVFLMMLASIPGVMASSAIEANIKNLASGGAEFDVSWIASAGGLSKEIPCSGEKTVKFDKKEEIKTLSCPSDGISSSLDESKTYRISICLTRNNERSCEVVLDKYSFSGCSPCSGPLCSEDKCSNLGKCLFKKSLVGGNCVSCKSEGITTCEDYGPDKEVCLDTNPCKLEKCVWNGEKCITKKSLKILVVPLVSGDMTPIRNLASKSEDLPKYRLLTFTKEPNLFEDYFGLGLSSWFPCDMEINIDSTEPLDISHLDISSGGSFIQSILQYAKTQEGGTFDRVVATLESITVYDGDSLETSTNIEIVEGYSTPLLEIIPFYKRSSRIGKTIFDMELIDEGFIAESYAHELGHYLGELCDEGYTSGTMQECYSGIATCTKSESAMKSDGSASGCLICTSGKCCPNMPEKQSLMCSYDECGRGCTRGSFFAKSSNCQLIKELSKNGYCGYNKDKEDEYCE